MIQEFKAVRQWKKIRGIGDSKKSKLDVNSIQDLKAIIGAYTKVQEESSEVIEAIIANDMHEFKDAIGDTIVTLINLAAMLDINAEDCLEQAFNEIELRKGLLDSCGIFVRYGKLGEDDRLICDEKQGNPGSQFFERSKLKELKPINFTR